MGRLSFFTYMKILQAGANPFEKKCRRCGTIFVYDNSDVTTYTEEDGYGKSNSFVICPVCKLQICAAIIPSILPESTNEDFDL